MQDVYRAFPLQKQTTTQIQAVKRASRRKSTSGYRQRLHRFEEKISEAAVAPPVVISGIAGAGDMACCEMATSIRRAISDCLARWPADCGS
uniref:Uncharacterized protein n=1 Tax=Hyaloperonospora arabidopsidis (strain Emoy2) TaxID=559515 RepID=M4BQ34_HYAAE